MPTPWSGRDRLVLDFVEEAPRGRHRWLLWPAWQYRVHAPVVAEARMNVFQRAILRLCRTGTRRPDQLGERLCLEPDLCDNVLDQLRNYGYLTDEHELTDSGADALATGELDPLDSVVVYVFQDPFTQQLWPSATDRLYPGEVVWPRGRPVLLRGDAGDRVEYDCVAVTPPDGAQPRRPETTDILQAVRRFKLPDRVARDPVASAGERTIRRTSMVDSQPEPVWLATYLFGDWRTEAESFPWQARDPLDSGPSTMLRRLVMARSEEDETLRAAIDHLGGRRQAARIEELRRLEAEVRRDVAGRLDRDLTLRIREHEEIHKLLVDMETNYALGKDGRGGTAFENAARDALRIFEEVFRDLLRQYPPAPSDVALFSRHDAGRQVRELVLAQARILGITRTDGLAQLVRKPYLLHQVAQNPSKAAFQPSLPVLVLATRNRPGHPLARAARHRPDLIDTLMSMAHLRNATAHAGITDLAQDDVDWTREALLSLLPLLLFDVPTRVKEGTST